MRPLRLTVATTLSVLSLGFGLTLPAPPVRARGAGAPARAADAKAGWRPLFDGKTTKGWRGFGQTTFPTTGWKADGGMLFLTPPAPGGKGPGDIVTEETFGSFELAFEYKVAEGGNSGVKYLVDESLVKDGGRAGLGFEFQIVDDDRHPDAKKGDGGNRSAGALYDLIAPGQEKRVNPAGSWNEARLLVNGNHVEHWLNGKKVLAYERGSEALKALIAKSKYKPIAGFGESAEGRILLQDHGDAVWYRNLRVRRIAVKPAAAPK